MVCMRPEPSQTRASQALDAPISFDAESCGPFLGSLGSPRKLHVLGVISGGTLQLETIGESVSVC